MSEFSGGRYASQATRVKLIPGPEGPQGPVGPEGPPGPAGSLDSIFYLHQQTTPLASWVVNHSLGFQPNVHVTDNSGNTMVGNVIHHSTSQTELQFNSPQTGTARFS